LCQKEGGYGGRGPPLNEGRGYAKDRRGVYIGYINYQHNVHKYM